MPTPILDLRTVQLGVETTRGTLVAATHVVDFKSATLRITPTYIITSRSGSLATSHRTDAGITDYEIEIVTAGTYDRIACMLPFFLAPTITGTGAGADKTWVFTPSDTTDNLKSASIEVGGVDTWPQEMKFAGCVGKSFKIEITQDDLWNCTWVFQGGTKTNASKTGALTAAATLIDIVGWSTKVYIDSTTVHTTNVTGQLLSGTINCVLGTTPRHYLGATAPTPTAVQQTSRRNVTLDLVGEWQNTTEFAAWEAGTLRKISVESTGAVLGSGTYNARFDFYGRWNSWQLGDATGAITQELSGKAEYNSTATADITATIVNSIAAVP